MRGLLLICAILVVSACAALPTGGDNYVLYGRTPLHPPPIQYVTWWSEMRDCAYNMIEAGVPGRLQRTRFGDVRWYSSRWIANETDGRPLGGITELGGRRITIQQDYVYDWMVVSHESLHLLVHPWSHGRGVFAACDPLRTPA